MRKLFLFFVIFALALPAGSAFGQSAIVMTFTNTNDALAYEELRRICLLTKDNAEYFIERKDLGFKQALEARLKSWGGKINKESLSWLEYVARSVIVKGATSQDVYTNCMLGGKALHDYDKNRIAKIKLGKLN